MGECLHLHTVGASDHDTPEGMVEELCADCGETILREPGAGGWQKYFLLSSVTAKRIEEAKEIETPSGPVPVHAGDYLCLTPDGDPFIVPASIFEAVYRLKEG